MAAPFCLLVASTDWPYASSDKRMCPAFLNLDDHFFPPTGPRRPSVRAQRSGDPESSRFEIRIRLWVRSFRGNDEKNLIIEFNRRLTQTFSFRDSLAIVGQAKTVYVRFEIQSLPPTLIDEFQLLGEFLSATRAFEPSRQKVKERPFSPDIQMSYATFLFFVNAVGESTAFWADGDVVSMGAHNMQNLDVVLAAKREHSHDQAGNAKKIGQERILHFFEFLFANAFH